MLANLPSSGIIQSYNVFRAHSTGYANTQPYSSAQVKPQNIIQRDSVYWAVREICSGNKTRSRVEQEKQELTIRQNEMTLTQTRRRIIARKSAPVSMPIHAFIPPSHRNGLASPCGQLSSVVEPDSFDDLCEADSIAGYEDVVSDEEPVLRHSNPADNLSRRAMTRGQQLMQLNSQASRKITFNTTHSNSTRSMRSEVSENSTPPQCLYRLPSTQQSDDSESAPSRLRCSKRLAVEVATCSSPITRYHRINSPSNNVFSDSDNAISSPVDAYLIDSKRRRISNHNVDHFSPSHGAHSRAAF